MVRSDFEQGMKKNMYDYGWEKFDIVKPRYQQIFDEQSETAAYSQGTSVIGARKLEEKTSESQDAPEESVLEGWTTLGKMRTFHKMHTWSKETVRQNQKMKDIVKKTAGGWGQGYALTKDEFYAKFFNYGGYTAGHDVFNASIAGVVTDPTGDLMYDSRPLFNFSGNTRTNKSATTYYNGLALSLTATNLETMINRLCDTNAKNESDELVGFGDDSEMVMVVPTRAMEFKARRILESTLIPGNANNDTNVLKGIADCIYWRELGAVDTDAWFVGYRKKGLIALSGWDLEYDFWIDNASGAYKAKVDCNFGARIDSWKPWVGSNFSTSA